jgi:uncharacterized protein (DUF302 family)
MFIIGLVTGVAVTLLTVVIVAGLKMFVVKQSKLGFHETVAAIEKSATDLNWGMPHKYDLQATLKGKGYDVNPVQVISLCKPNLANQVLSDDKERHISAILPCRISVYIKNDKTYISYMNAAFVSNIMSKKVKSLMNQVGSELEVVVKQVVK